MVRTLLNRKKDIMLVIRNLGAILQGLGIVTVIPILLTYFYRDEMIYIQYFLFPGVITFIIGSLMKKVRSDVSMQIRHAMMVSSLAWLISALVGSIPFMFIAKLSFVNSYFESMSAFSGTGLTMFGKIYSVETLPKILLFWRSFEQWVGGIGIILVAMIVLIRPGVAAARLYIAEGRGERIKPSLPSTVKVIWKIYFFYTILGILLFFIVGMPLFDSINHCMTGLGTGGMSLYNDSIAHYHSFPIEIVAVFLMILGAINFSVHYRAIFKRRFKELFGDVQFKALFMIGFFVIIIIGFDLISKYGIIEGLRNAFFQGFSAITCCGFSTANLAEWGEIAKSSLIILMIIGGGAGSTAGAIKLVRIALILTVLKNHIKKSLLPNSTVMPVKMGGAIFKNKDIIEALLFTIVYIGFLLGGSFILMQLGHGALNSMFEMASAQGNVGLSIGITSPTLPLIGKITLILGMWMGRLEIIPTLVFISNILFFLRRKEKI
ncbi:MAG: TrkH family potassium uptake protein [Methanomicrobia archaeon]|nr:TrkH family potassium uptake protein [Methanomicrobia archaeon]RLF93790.1 MAG: TrkH family potassium uptake protein [Thermococci archaeon]RLF95973.1 MAG: TrkH family potassium uptake protein [Thermococci archaeon]HDN82040.1 TrkH family potassium uptake protein [Methanomicrobia archaeon]